MIRTRAFRDGRALLVMTGVASAQKYPSRNIEVIIPFAAGGGVDLIGRSIAASLAEQLGQSVIVQNRDGAGGTIGFGALAAASPDGYTLGFGPSTPIANAPYLVKGVRYNPESFDYICQVFENPFSIAVGPNSPYKTAQGSAGRRQGQESEFRPCGPRLDSASVGREFRRCDQDQGAASAVPRRCRHAAGADEGRSRFRRAGAVVDPRQRSDPSAGGVHGQAYSVLSGCSDRGRTRRQDLGAARPERTVRAEGIAGRGQGRARQGVRDRGEIGWRAESGRQHRVEHRLYGRQAVSRPDRRRLQVQGRADQATGPRRESDRCVARKAAAACRSIPPSFCR